MKKKLRKIKLIIEYDGTEYFGWQVQPGMRTIQQEIEKSIYKITKERVRVTGAGRTDAGVHAYGQVAHFLTSSSIENNIFAPALNSVLPEDISVLTSKKVPTNFHARRSATGKHYRYLIFNRRIPSPLARKRAYCLNVNLDVEKMKSSSLLFIGKKNYSSFASNAKRKVDPIREISSVRVSKKGSFISIDVKGKSFMYKMVRAIAGTLVEIGNGKDLDINSIFKAKKRKYAGRNLPPHGLYLLKVYYT
ncbi:MAG: tRNA pseudouridine(38-40) synthase TruA [Candidatus Aureabacteria bacterium]|nr:tRNA pseudouridine(38-40) synthase TruA [Candidatus Auribacterota bacterium]